MSQESSGFPQQHGVTPQSPLGLNYIPTEEERRIFRECGNESFWYRSLPFSVVGMAVTQGLISRGVLTASGMFGSLPKLAFAGFCGYLAGKISYMDTCVKKFKNLENSPLADALRREHHNLPARFPPQNQSEFEDGSQSDFEPLSLAPADRRGPAHSYGEPAPFGSGLGDSTFQPAPFSSALDDSSFQPAPYSSSLDDSTYQPAPFSSALSESAPSGTGDDFIPQAPPYLDDEKPKKKTISYEELRSKNRENYGVTMTQKAETLLKPSPDRATPRKEVKKNIYGDTWEE
ncbi:hypothetical protein AGOR_G00171620 [Albula goreensis]|uniref:OCIA domain-containing protein 1 n=1 Tax=Albula goreensis TaxID=1534307 RepID=A0A8T3CTQ6_9TELE|nr:hypothetical protein AGOR_G00171620 [Albula goreensis]